MMLANVKFLPNAALAIERIHLQASRLYGEPIAEHLFYTSITTSTHLMVSDNESYGREGIGSDG
jgi:hypothetical protein